MNIRRYLELSQQVEETVAAIYQGFVERFGDDPELCALWRQMAKDEYDHAMQIKLAFPLVKEGLLGEARLEVEKLEALLLQARQLRTDVERRDLAAAVALRLGLQMEERFCQVHLLAQTEIGRADLKELFRRLARADEEHIATLQRGLARCQQGAAGNLGV